MSTSSRLRMVLSSGEALKPVYCHWDGYPSNMMPILEKCYNTPEKVRELLALGDLSYIAEKVKPDEGEEHSFDKPAKNVTVAYHRDRGEELQFSSDRQCYNYVFNGDCWKLE